MRIEALIQPDGKALFRVTDDSGTTHQRLTRPQPTASLDQWARRVGTTSEDLLSALRAPAPTDPSWLRVRGVFSPQSSAPLRTTDNLAAAIEAEITSSPEEWSVIEWEDREQVAALDVTLPGDPHLLRHDLLPRLHPRPFAWWVTHGGGGGIALYRARGGFSAYEFASAGAVWIADASPTAVCSVTSRVTHPGAPRGEQPAPSVQTGHQDLRVTLPQWGSDGWTAVGEDDVISWLASRGLEMGLRYPHELCPFSPEPSSSKEPVIVKDDGILCFRCRHYGLRGWAGWDELVSGRRVSRVAEAAKSLVPWEHVRYVVLEDYGSRLPPPVLRSAYVALCKGLHDPEDPRVPRVTRTFGLARGAGGVWLDSDTLRPISPPPKTLRLAELPSTRYAWLGDDEIWQEAPNKVALDRHATNQSLPGWPEIVAVRGARIWGQFLPYGEQRFTRATVADSTRYVPPNHRKPDIRGRLRGFFPGIDLRYLELLLVARGFAESGVGQVPLILVTGPSGSAKTATVSLASAIAGDRVRWVHDGDYQESLGTALGEAGFVLLDEFVKDLKPRDIRRRFNFLLEVKREFSYRRLYVGPTTIPCRSAIIVANNAYGPEVIENQQIGRRMVYVPLTARTRVRWEEVCGGSIDRWITQHRDLADEFLSEVIDTHFTDLASAEDGSLSFISAAREIGFDLLEAQEESEGVTTADLVREFFSLVPALAEAPSRWKGRGWRMVDLDDLSSEATRLWRELGDGDGEQAMRVDELDLALVLGSPEPVSLRRSLHGRRLGVKFQMGNGRRYLVNEEIPVDF